MASASASNPSSHVTHSGRLVATVSLEALDPGGCERRRDADLCVIACFLVATCPPFRYRFGPEPTPSSPPSDYPGKAAANRRGRDCPRTHEAHRAPTGLVPTRAAAAHLTRRTAARRKGRPLPPPVRESVTFNDIPKSGNSRPSGAPPADPSPLPVTRRSLPLAPTPTRAVTVPLTAGTRSRWSYRQRRCP